MHTSLLFTTSLVLALAPSVAVQDASCQASAHESAACQKASAVSVKATTVAAPVVASDDDAPACCAEKAQTVALDTVALDTVAQDTVAQDTMSDDEIANLLKEVRAALAEVESAAQEATKLEAAALPTALAALGYAATPDERGYMGVSLQVGDGATIIQEVLEGSGAAKAGLRAGDRILTIGGQSAEDAEVLMAHLGDLQAGDTVRITYERDGKQRKAKIELSTLAAIESGGTGGTGEQRELEKVEASEGVIEWFELGDGDIEEIMEVASEQEHELRVFTQKGGNRKVHVIGADDLHFEGLEGLMDLEAIGVDLEASSVNFEDLKGLLGKHGVQLHLEGLEGLKALENLHLDLGELGNLKGLQGNIRININGEDIDLSEFENLGGMFEVRVEADEELSGEHQIEIHEVHGDSKDIRQRVIQRLGGKDGRHIVQFGKQPVVVDLKDGPEIKTDVKFGYAIAVTGEDGEHQIIEIKGLPDGDFMKNFKFLKGIHVEGGNVIHLRHDDGDDDDDSPSHGFFFSDDDNIKFEHRGQVIIKTQINGGETEVLEFTFGGEDGELPEKIRELLKSHGGVGQGFFAHGDGDHEFKVDIQAFTEGKGGNVHILRSHAGGDEDVLFFTDEDHELPEGVRKMMMNRVQFDPQGGRWSFTVDVDVDVDDDDDDDHHGMRVFEFDGGNWTGDFLGRFDNQELGRRIRERVERGMQRVQLREVREGRGRDDVRGLEHEIEALRDRIQELERAIERLGRRR